MPNDRELSWIDKKLLQCEAIIRAGKEIGLPDQSASLPIEEYKALFEALKSAREVLGQLTGTAASHLSIKAAIAKIDALGRENAAGIPADNPRPISPDAKMKLSFMRRPEEDFE